MTVGYRFPLVRVHRTFVGKKTGLAGKRARKGCGRDAGPDALDQEWANRVKGREVIKSGEGDRMQRKGSEGKNIEFYAQIGAVC